MIGIKLFKGLFPIYTLRGSVEILKMKDMDWYLDCMRSDFYGEYNLSKYSVSQEQFIVEHMKSVINNTELEVDTEEELRFIFKVDGNNIGGGSLLNKGDDINIITISYFILPKYQKHLYASEMVTGILGILKDTHYKYVEAHIQTKNKSSLRLVKRLKFKKYKRYKYDTCDVDYYRWEIQR